MNTLREIGEFIGIPQGSIEVAGIFAPNTTTLEMASILVTKKKALSMQAIIEALKNLTPITLEAQIAGSSLSGDGKLQLVIRLNASGGIVWFTVIVEVGEKLVFLDERNLGAKGGFFTAVQNLPGDFHVIVRRAGISNTGFVSLSKTL